MTKNLHLNVSGMTCGKCERLIREGILEEVKTVKEVDVDRPGGKVTVHFQNAEDFEAEKDKILSIINSLVNGKFTATVDSGAGNWNKWKLLEKYDFSNYCFNFILLVSNNDVLKPWEEFDDLQEFDNQSENR